MAKLQHLLGLEGLGRKALEALLERARAHLTPPAASDRPLAGRSVALLFYETSTRTRMSFERAAHDLGAQVINFTAAASSVQKGETLIDTARNVEALGVAALVLRHPSSGAAQLVARSVRAAVVNAGDGTHEHPTQALADAFTLQQKLGTLEGKRVVIAGDLLHSRVARSNIHCLRALGATVVFSAPPTLIPAGSLELGALIEPDFDKALESADAVMMLRIQLERQQQSLFPSFKEYARHWGLSVARAAKLGAHVPVLHPGPMNRGVEIAPEVADSERALVLDQVRNGVAVRRAVLEAVCG